MLTLTREQLRGLPREKASLYGLPHLGARYHKGMGARRYCRTATCCVVCGRPATNCHHVVPLSVGHTFEMVTPNGTFELHSPLFALCGSGTDGCHNGFHGGATLKARWVWDSEKYERAWWSGELLARFGAHSKALFAYGRWEIENTRLGITLSYREEY